MKILMINSVCGIRSTGRICTDLAIALEAEGHDVKIAYGRETNIPEQFQKYAVRIGTDLDVKLHVLKARFFDAAGFGSRRATKQFLRWVKEYDPDVIHLHNLHGYYINIELLFNYLKTYRKRIIWTLHDCWAFTGHSAYCDAVGCKKWKTGCSHCPEVGEYPKSILDHSSNNWERKKRIMQGLANMSIVTPSNWLSALAKESFLGEYPVRVIHNGIDTSQFHRVENNYRTRYGIGERFIILGVATVWNDMKGYSDFIKLSEMLDDTYRVVMIGLSKEEIKKIPSNILGVQRTNNLQELVSFYSIADVFLNLSYTESYGLTNVEAQLCGVPVICYDSGALRETAGISGIVIERGNVDAVEKAVRYVRGKDLKVHVLSMDQVRELDRKQTINQYMKIICNTNDSNMHIIDKDCIC